MASDDAQEEILAPARPAGDLPGVLYHYTTASGLLGIIGSGSFWATDVRFLNDVSEIKFGAKYLKEEAVVAASERWMRGMVEVAFLESLPIDLEVATVSYCVQGDLLSQWRGYAGSAGYSIGIDTEACARIIKTRGVANPFVPVIYDREAARGYAKSVAHELIRRWSSTEWHKYAVANREASREELAEAIGGVHEEEMIRITIAAVAGVRVLSARLKDPAFAEEQEWRTVASIGRNEALPVQFRESAVGMTPYVVIDTRDENGKVPLKEIVVGPGPDQDLRIAAATMFLKRSGYSEDVVVRGSAIPFR